MKKRIVLILVLILAAAALVSCAKKPDYGVNLLKNGDFSDGLRNWKHEAYIKDKSSVEITEYTLNGMAPYSPAVRIENTDYNKTTLSQTVRVERGEIYKLTVKIHIEESFFARDTSAGKTYGAYISVGELWELAEGAPSSNGNGAWTGGNYPVGSPTNYQSQSYWEYFVVFVKADNVDKITVQLRCGRDSGDSKGKALFANVKCEKVKAKDAPAATSTLLNVVTYKAENNIASYLFVALLGVLFAFLAFLAYEYIAKELKKKVKPAVIDLPPEPVKTLAAAESDKVAPAEIGKAPPRKKKISKEAIILLASLAVIGAVKLLLSGLFYGHGGDVGTFRAWAGQLADGGIVKFYESASPACDYPPGYLYILWFIGVISRGLSLSAGSPAELMLLKLPALLADIGAALLVYLILKRALKNRKIALAGALMYAVNIAVFVNSQWWGQVDAVLAALLLLTLYFALTKRYLATSLVYAAAILFKFQAVFIAPVVGAYLVTAMVKDKDKRTAIGLYIAAAVLGWFVLTLPFSVNQIKGGDTLFIFKQYFNSAGNYNYLTLNAFNFYGTFNLNYRPIGNKTLADVLNYAMIIALSAVCIIFYLKYKGKGNIIILLSAYLVTAIFMFSVKMHERYLFPALILLFVSALLIRDRRLYFTATLFTLLHYLNTAGLLLTENNTFAGGSAFMIIGSALSLAAFIYLTYVTADVVILNRIRPIKNYTQIFGRDE